MVVLKRTLLLTVVVVSTAMCPSALQADFREGEATVDTDYGFAFAKDTHDQTVQQLLARAREHVLVQQHGLAINDLQQALYRVHQQQGVHSLAQLDVLNEMARSYVNIADLSTADATMRRRHDLIRRHFNQKDPEYIDASVELAQWYQARRNLRGSDRLMRELASDLLAQDVHGESRQVPLKLLTFNEYLKGHCCNLRLVERGLAAVLKDGQASNLDRAVAMRDAADVLMISGRSKKAVPLYQSASAHGLAGDAPVWLGFRTGRHMIIAYTNILDKTRRTQSRSKAGIAPGQMVGSPIPFCKAQLSRVTEVDALQNYAVELEYSVGENGRAEDIQVTRSNTPKVVNALVRRVLATGRFRPAMDAGTVVEVRHRLIQTFDQDAALLPVDNAFTPSNIAVFHACTEMAMREGSLMMSRR